MSHSEFDGREVNFIRFSVLVASQFKNKLVSFVRSHRKSFSTNIKRTSHPNKFSDSLIKILLENFKLKYRGHSVLVLNFTWLSFILYFSSTQNQASHCDVVPLYVQSWFMVCFVAWIWIYILEWYKSTEYQWICILLAIWG